MAQTLKRNNVLGPTDKKVRIDSLPKNKQPTQLLPLTKMIAATVKMIANRAETAMVALLKRHQNKEMEARALVRELLISAGDIKPDAQTNTLIVRIHRMVTPAHDQAIAALFEDCNALGFSILKPGKKCTTHWCSVPMRFPRGSGCLKFVAFPSIQPNFQAKPTNSALKHPLAPRFHLAFKLQ